MRTIMLCIGLLLSWTNAHAVSICTDTQFRQSLETPGNLKPLNALKLGPTHSKLMIFGEAHFHTSTDLLVEIINTFAPSLKGNKCLFFEFASSVTAKELIDKVKEALPQLPPGASQERSDYTELLNYYEPILAAANSQALKVITVDHPENFGQGMDLNIRDQSMIEAIAKKLSSECDEALMFVGKAHISADSSNRTTLKMQLQKNGISFQTFNVQHASDPVPQELASWNKLCESALPSPVQPVVFSNQLINPSTELWPNLKSGAMRSGSWRDFDFTILAP